MEEIVNQEKNIDKNVDPINVLQKIIRVDRKHSNFQFEDYLLKSHIKVSSIPPEQFLPGDHLLKHYWKHVSNFYFKKIQSREFQRLDYLRKLFSFKNKRTWKYCFDKQFWRLLQKNLSSTYLNKIQNSQQKRLELNNHISWLFLLYKNIQNKTQKSSREQLNEMNKLKGVKQLLNSNDKKKGNQIANLQKLKNQQRQLQKLIPQANKKQSQIDLEIKALQQQLTNQNLQNVKILYNLEKRVLNQLNQNQIIYILNNDECLDDIDQKFQIQSTVLSKDSSKNLQNVDKIDVQLEYIRYAINQMEKKQIAQSISKVIQFHKFQNEQKFQVCFDKSLNLKNKLMTQQQLKYYNGLRQASLFKYYSMSMKTHFSINCQNLAGFRQVFKNHNKPCKYYEKKDQQLINLIKKSTIDPNDSSAQLFKQFDTCHHCKQFYHKNFLQKCNYNSSKGGKPLAPSSFFNPYLMQASKIEGTGNGVSSNSQRFSMRKKNIMFSYSKKDQQFCCDRKFCKYCLTKTYAEGFDKNGHCPFCQGICYCSRCTRNQMIIKLKSIYHLLGGNVAQLCKNSELQKLTKLQQEFDYKNGRHRKNSILKSKSKINSFLFRSKSQNQIDSLRNQLQDVKMLCDLVKKREKKKQKISESSINIFKRKVSLISNEYFCKRSANDRDKGKDQNQQRQEKMNTRKMIKKM